MSISYTPHTLPTMSGAATASASSSSVRLQILKHALPLLPVHSFSRQSLLRSLPSLDPSHPDYRNDIPESIIDTLFGPGNTGASQALVEAWHLEGLHSLHGTNVRERLKSRLRFSSQVGEHLVEVGRLVSSVSLDALIL